MKLLSFQEANFVGSYA